MSQLRLSEEVLEARARRLAWLLVDVDGVLTDGRLAYGPDGGPAKAFNVKDGLGLKLAQGAGLKVGVLSARSDAATERRAADLDLDALVIGRRDKAAAFAQFLAREKVAAAEVAYAGDDLPDLPVLARAGLSFAPADAVPEVRARVSVVLAAGGGGGAVREMVELILKARGSWTELTVDWQTVE